MEKVPVSTLRNEEIKCAATIFGKTMLAWVVALMLALSLSFIFTALGTEVNGYDIFDKDGKKIDHVEILDPDAPITSDTQTEVKLEEGQTYVETRSALTPPIKLLQDGLQTFMALLMLLALPCHTMWTRGDKDRNRVDYGGMKALPYRGFMIGVLTAIPSFITYLLLIISRFGVLSADYMTLFRLIHTPVLTILRIFIPSSVPSTDLNFWQLLWAFPWTVLLVPAVCGLSYLVGFKRFAFTERLIYRKKQK